MKSSYLKRFALALLLLIVSIFAAPVIGVAAWALPIAALLNYSPAPCVLGASYTRINASTLADGVSDTANAKEQLWVHRIMKGHDGLYQDAPLAEGGLMGRVNGGETPNPRDLQKAVIEMMETRTVLGDTIHIPTMAGLAGPIVTGEGDRIGGEQKIHEGSYDVTIGRGWFGAGWTGIRRDQTVLGSRFDQWANNQFRKQHAKKKNDDHLMLMRAAFATNGMYPDGISTLATIKTANVMDTTLVTNLGEELPSRGAECIDTSDDSGGSNGECYILLAVHRALSPMLVEPAYLEAQKEAGVRGEGNRVFKGGFSKWNGHGIYRWYSKDHANKGPLGSPLEPRARLGVAITGGTTSTVIQGGGLVYSSTETPLPQYFEFFQNAYYKFFNGTTIARVTSPTRHVMIINNDNSGYGVYPYTTVGTGAADASIITISGAALSIGVGTETTNHPQGSLVVQCNILGVPYGWSVFLGAQAIASGYGRIDGTNVNPIMGRRTSEIRNHQNEFAVGAEMAWGNALVKRAGDNAAPNFMVALHAIPVQGAPTIS